MLYVKINEFKVTNFLATFVLKVYGTASTHLFNIFQEYAGLNWKIALHHADFCSWRFIGQKYRSCSSKLVLGMFCAEKPSSSSTAAILLHDNDKILYLLTTYKPLFDDKSRRLQLWKKISPWITAHMFFISNGSNSRTINIFQFRLHLSQK